MEDSNFKFRILSLDRFNYPMLKSRLIDLYLTAFTQGEYAQYIDKADAEETVEFLIENGFGYIAIYNEEIVAFTLATTLSGRFAEDKKRGPLGYVRNVLESVVDFRAEEYEITYDEGSLTEKAFILTCANASQYGNEAYIAPNASMDDGMMNVSILKPLNALEIPQTTIQLFTKNIEKNSKMISLLTQKLHIKRASPGLMHMDGEPVLTDSEIEVRVIPKGLNVFTPTPSEINEKKRKENETIFNSLTRWFN
jgi:hypothetical protein